MRKLITILFVCLLQNGFGQTTYYVSNSGSDAANGTSTSTAWQTISKINSTTFSPGDNILFRKGDTFYGTITVSQSGTSGNPITFGAYGSGNNPVITGFTTVSSWTNLGSNIWESTSSVSTLSSCNMVTIMGVNTPMGRYPNTGWLTYQSFSGSTSITSSSLTGTPDWTGATAVIKKYRYVIDRGDITAQSGGTLTYSNGTVAGQNNYGFFIENDLRTLDTQNEWYYNSSTKKIDVYSTASPSNVNVASVTNLVYGVNKNYITFDGLTFTGSSGDAFYLSNSGNWVIQNCTFDYNYKSITGYQGGGTSSVTIQNNTFNHSNSDCISLTTEFAGSTVSNNIIKNTGLFEGMASTGQTRWAINTTGANYTIQNNEVDSTGYIGIGSNGSNVLIDKNLVNYFCLTTDDGSGIYTGNPQTSVVISNNIVLNGIGNYLGTTYTTPAANGIYCDDNSSGMTLLNNSIANIAFAAIFLHQAKNIEVRGNTTYNAHIGLLVDRDNTADHTTGINVHKNTFVGTSSGTMNTLPDQISLWFKTAWTTAGDIQAFGTVDSNYYARPIDDGNTIMGTVYGVADTYYTLSSWQSYSGYDTHSNKSPKTITDQGDLIFVYNYSASSATQSLGYQYIDIANTTYNSGSITLAPYSSKILIKNGALAAAPTISISGNQTITVDNTSVSAVATWASGHTGTYSWTKISGPGTTTIGSPTSASTTVMGLQTGTYVLRCTVTQDDSQSTYAEVTITVNIPNVPPTANAGVDQTITLPTNQVTLTGSGTDSDGSIANYSWSKVSGGTATITSASSATTTVTGLAAGVYVFRLTVTDNSGATGTDDVQVTVNIPPIIIGTSQFVSRVPLKLINKP